MCEKSGETVDLALMEPVLEEYNNRKGTLIPVLQQAQALYGYLPRPVLEVISKRLRLPMSKIYGVATFYSQFYLTRRGRHIIRQCDGTACHVRGAAKVVEKIEQLLGIKAGETTPDYRVTCEVVYCLGSCGLAPVAFIDGSTVGRLVPEKMAAIIGGMQ